MNNNNKDIEQDDYLQNYDVGKKGFDLPVKYFEDLPFKINTRREVRKAKVGFWFWTSSAVAVCSIVLALFLFDNGSEQVDYYSEVNENEEYSKEYLDQEITEEDLIDFIINEDQEINNINR